MPRARRPLRPVAAMLAELADDFEAAAGEPHAAERDAGPLWLPLPDPPGRAHPQRMALESPADELFYGGAGGGGKTDLLLGCGMTQHRNGVIFRTEFTQFRGALGMIERSREIVGLRGEFREGHVWRGLPGNRALEFAAVKHDDDLKKWKGRPHDFIGFDELPEFPLAHFRFLGGWLRTTRVGQRVRIIGTGNPPTDEAGKWIIAYWGPWLDPKHPRPAKPGELRYYAVIDDRDVDRPDLRPYVHVFPGGRELRVVPRSRTFIPASVEDNPFLMETGYDQQLNNLPEPLRSQLRFGDFTAGVADDPWQLIPTAWVRAAQARWTADGHGGQPVTAAGCDPSRGGAAEFVVARRHGAWVAPLAITPGKDVPDGEAGAAVLMAAVKDRGIPVRIDIIGTAGGSVYDHARALKMQAVAMNGSAASAGTDRATGKLGFVNLRAEWHWRMREQLDPAWPVKLALPPDDQLRSDLCAPRWRPTPRGIQVEAKEDIMARLGRSPDRGDAVIYCCAPDSAAEPSLEDGAEYPLFY